MKMHKVLCGLLVVVGFLQMLGHVAGQKWLKGMGALTVASPLPIVFTEVKGVETFAQDFYLVYENEDSEVVQTKVTPQLYSQFNAPYNYRNVLGAAVSYGPVLPEPVWHSVLSYAFVEPGDVASAFDLKPPLNQAAIYIETRTRGRSDSWKLMLDKKEEVSSP